MAGALGRAALATQLEPALFERVGAAYAWGQLGPSAVLGGQHEAGVRRAAFTLRDQVGQGNLAEALALFGIGVRGRTPFERLGRARAFVEVLLLVAEHLCLEQAVARRR